MPFDNVLETFWWIFEILNHSKLNISISDDICISLVFLLSLHGALLMLEPWLIEINLL